MVVAFVPSKTWCQQGFSAENDDKRNRKTHGLLFRWSQIVPRPPSLAKRWWVIGDDAPGVESYWLLDHSGHLFPAAGAGCGEPTGTSRSETQSMVPEAAVAIEAGPATAGHTEPTTTTNLGTAITGVAKAHS